MAVYCIDYINGLSGNDGSAANPWSELNDVFSNVTSWNSGDEVRIAGTQNTNSTTIPNISFTEGSANIIAYDADVTSSLSAGDYIRKSTDNAMWRIQSISFNGTDTIMDLYVSDGLYPFESETVSIEKIYEVFLNVETFTIDGYSDSEYTVISGGWNSTFTTQDDNTILLTSSSNANTINYNNKNYYKMENVNFINDNSTRTILYNYFIDYEDCSFYTYTNRGCFSHIRNSIFSGCTFTSDNSYFVNYNSNVINESYFYDCTFSCFNSMFQYALVLPTSNNNKWYNCEFKYNRAQIGNHYNSYFKECGIGLSRYSNFLIESNGIVFDDCYELNTFSSAGGFLSLCSNINFISDNTFIEYYDIKYCGNINITTPSSVFNYINSSGLYQTDNINRYEIGGGCNRSINDTDQYTGSTCVKYSISVNDYLQDINFIKIPITTGYSTYEFSFYTKNTNSDSYNFSVNYNGVFPIEMDSFTPTATWTKISGSIDNNFITKDGYIYLSLFSDGLASTSDSLYIDYIVLDQS